MATTIAMIDVTETLNLYPFLNIVLHFGLTAPFLFPLPSDQKVDCYCSHNSKDHQSGSGVACSVLVSSHNFTVSPNLLNVAYSQLYFLFIVHMPRYKDTDWQFHILYLKKIADDHNITNAEMARKCNVNRSTIGRVLSLEQCPSLQLYLDMKAFLESL